MHARRRDRRPTLECLEDRLALSSANASPDAFVGQTISQASQMLNTYPGNGKGVLEFLGYENRGQLYSELIQGYHEST
jgi:hypothetical protein